MSQTQSQRLDGARIAILVAPEGTENVEFTEPKTAVTDAGASVDVLSTETGEARTVEDDLESSETIEIEQTVTEADPEAYDALIVPGGTVGADTLRADEDAVEFVREQMASDTTTAAICHGPWTLVEAGAVDNRRLTSYPSLQTDVRNAGGTWVDEEVVTDGNLITSRKPDDLSAFCETIVETVAER